MMSDLEERKLRNEERKLEQESYKQFNDNQSDTRKRVDQYVRYVITMSGVALTISIGLFTNQNAPDLDHEAISYLQWAWGSLAISIMSMLSTMLFIIVGAYILGREWMKVLEGQKDEAAAPLWSDIGAWVMGLVGTILFVIGLILLSMVAISSVMN